MRLALILSAVAVGCAGGLQPMDWPVSCRSTTVAELDQRFAEETRAVPAVTRGDFIEITHPSPVMWGCDALQPLEDCPAFHRVWRRYWAARRELAACQ